MLFTLVTPVKATHADDEAESVGTASVQDDQASSDSIAISLTGIPKASDGTSYNAYLESGDGSNTLNLGTGSVELPVVHGVIQGTGSLEITYDSSSVSESFTAPYAELRDTLVVGAIRGGSDTGSLFFQQVQVSGDA